MKRIFIIFCLTFFICPIYAFNGFYAGVGGGIATFNSTAQNNVAFFNGNTGTQITNTGAASVYWGYQYNKFVGGQLEFNNVFDTTVANSFQTNQRLLGLSVIGSLPLFFIKALSSLSLYGKIGIDYSVINYSNVNSNCNQCSAVPDSSFAILPLYGAGVAYDFNDFGIRAEFDYSPNNTVSQNDASVYTTTTNLYLLSAYYKF